MDFSWLVTRNKPKLNVSFTFDGVVVNGINVYQSHTVATLKAAILRKIDPILNFNAYPSRVHIDKINGIMVSPCDKIYSIIKRDCRNTVKFCNYAIQTKG